MPIALNWFDDKNTVLLYSFEGSWTWEEFHELDDPVWNLIAKVDYRIDLLIDWTQSAGFPLGIMASMHRAGENVIPQTDGLTISIGGPYLIKIMFGIFRRTYPKAAASYRLVDSVDDAIKLLEQERGTSITKSISPFKQSD